MNKEKIKGITVMAMLTALIAVATLIIQIPTPGTNGYVHPGDSLIFFSAIFFGRKYGFVAGGVGSALADLISGYAFWAPWTFIIKSIMGLIVGVLAYYEQGKLFNVRNILAMVAGTIILVFGYFLVSSQMQGGVAAAITGIPGNIMQGIVGMILFYLIGYPLDKVNIKNKIL